MLSPEWISVLVGEIRGYYPETEAIYLYGSQARGIARSDSDVDITVKMPEGMDVTRHDYDLNYHLTRKTGKRVSVVFCTIPNQWCEKLIYSKA